MILVDNLKLNIGFKDSDIIGYVIFIVGFISLISFTAGAMLYRASKQKNE